MEFSLFQSEREGMINGSGMQQLPQPLQTWGFEVVSGGSGSYGSERNGQSEEHEEHESGQSQLCARGHWRPAEDSKLRELVSQYGPQNWNVIAENLEGRSGKSCRLRWFNQLDPRINKKAFTEEEEERLLYAHGLYGNKWALIARYFPGRTDNAVKNHWHVIIARKQREQSNAHRRRKPSNTISTYASKTFDNRMQVNNGCAAESSYKDEPLSTCTDLSLNHSAYISFPGHGFFTSYMPREHQQPQLQQQPQTFGFLSGGNGCSQRLFYPESEFHHAFPLVLVPGADRCGYYDSNSEVSAMESVGKKRGDNIILDEAENDREKVSLPFIDFLGVGAT